MCDNGQPPGQAQALEEGAWFQDTKSLRAAAGEMFAEAGRSFVASRKGGGRQKMYLCSGHTTGCQAQVRAYKKQGGDEWRVHTVNTTHTNCSGGKTPGRSAAFQRVANQAFNDNPHLQGIQLKKTIERDFGVPVKHRVATTMNNTAKAASQAVVSDSYQQLPSLADLLQKNCPGTVAEVEKHPDGTFKRFGVMLGRAAFVCRYSPLKVLCVDAGFLKGEWEGVMLIATFKDANNTLVHLATVICDKENSDNYSFLYALMRKNSYMEEVLDSDKTTIYTDQHQSHPSALYLHARHAVWKWCLRHLITNLDQEVGQAVNGWIFHAARCPTAQQFHDVMEKHVKPTKPIAFAGLMALDLKRWAFHAGPADTVIGDQTTSNPVEQNMSMVGAQARALEPYGLVFSVLDKTSLKCAERAALRDHTEEKFTPFASRAYETQRNKSSELHASATGNGWYSVRKQGQSYGNRVRLLFNAEGNANFMSCTCQYPARWLIPCCDVIAVGRSLEKSDEVMNLIDKAYQLDTYRGMYDDERFMVQLPVADELTRDPTMLPPRPVLGKAGRPKGKKRVKRIPSRGETNASSSFNVPLSQGNPALSQGAPALSQGAVGVPPLSQGGGVSQGAPSLSQGGGGSVGGGGPTGAISIE